MRYDARDIYNSKKLRITLEQYAKDQSTLEYECFWENINSDPKGSRTKPDICRYSNLNAVDEKRIVKCFYKRTIENSKCLECVYENLFSYYLNEEALKNPDTYIPIDYELPAVPGKKMNVDLVLRGPDGVVYFVEVKPVSNNETLLRMILEIVTYTKLLNIDRREFGQYREWLSHLGVKENEPLQRAIMFFEGSKQESEFGNIKENKGSAEADRYLRIIDRDGISIFVAKKATSGGYIIKRLERHHTKE